MHASPYRPSRPDASSAFTLIELLTVIAIIGILAAIIIPTVGKVRQVAQKTACASNLRQTGMALFAYALDNKDGLPGSTLTTANGSTYYGLNRTVSPRWWVEGGKPTHDLVSQLLPYFSTPIRGGNGTGIAEVMVCPANQSTRDTLQATTTTPSYYLSTGVRLTNGTIRRPIGLPGTQSIKLGTIATPRTAVALFDIDTAFLGVLGAGPITNAPATAVHGTLRNVLFFDGHIQAIETHINPHETL